MGTEHSGRAASRPLAGIHIVEAIDGPMRAIGRLLAELGADVAHLMSAAEADDAAVADRAATFTYYNAGKRCIALDPAGPDGLDRLLRHGDKADILLLSAADYGPDGMTEIRRRFADRVVVAISPFGLSGDCAGWQLTEPVFFALSGVLSQSGNPGQAPLLPPPGLAFGSAAVQAVFVTLLAYWNRVRNGRGEFVDFSIFEGAALAYDPGYGVAGSASAGIPAYDLPRGRPEARFRYPILSCKDGHARICLLARRQWRNMYLWMGEPTRFADPKYDRLIERFRDPDLIPAIATFFATMTRSEIEAGGKAFGVPVAGLNTLAEAVGARHFAERNALIQVPVLNGDPIMLVNGVIEIDGERMGVANDPAQFDASSEAPAAIAPIGPVHFTANGFPPPGSHRPLDGISVLDLGVIVVGAEQGRLFGDQGADVVKIETSAFPDGTRQTQIPGTVPTAFAAGNRSKRGASVNLRTDQGRTIFRDLAKQADIVFSNYKPGTLEALGIDFETLSTFNPAIIMVDNSAYGPTGSWAQRMGYGPLVRAACGMTEMYRYSDEPAEFADAMTVYPDHVGGRLGAIGALALLIRRLRTGTGGRASVAQAEILLQHFGELIARGKDKWTIPDAPYGVFPAVGDDEWMVVSVERDSQFEALCRAIGRTDWADDIALRSAAGRCAHRARIDAGVGAWLATREPEAAMLELQEAGVPAAHMLRISQLPEFPAFRDRAVFVEYRHPAIERSFLVESSPSLFSTIPKPNPSPSPLIGQHTAEVLRERLKMSDAQIAALALAGDVEVLPTE